MPKGASFSSRVPMLWPMSFGVRISGSHLVATSTSPGFFPAAVSAFESACSDLPAP